MDALLEENKKLKEHIETQNQHIQEIEIKLKRYMNNDAHKKYYSTHKESIINQQNSYRAKIKAENPEKLKEYRKRSYQKEKEKKQLEQSNRILEMKNND